MTTERISPRYIPVDDAAVDFVNTSSWRSIRLRPALNRLFVLRFEIRDLEVVQSVGSICGEIGSW